jgi:hypothetical protein
MPFWSKLNAWHNTHLPIDSMPKHAHQDQRSLHHLLPRKFETLEVWLLAFCGVYGLLVTVSMAQSARNLLLACSTLLCMAGWRLFRPARTQTQWAMGALVTLLVVGFIYADPQSGGSTGPFWFLLLLMSISYPLLMDAPRVSILAVLMLSLYVATGWRNMGALTPERFALQGALIAGICGLTTRLGVLLRQIEYRVDRLRYDLASLAYNEHGLTRYGTALLNRCIQEEKPCTLVLLSMPSDWHEPIDVSGRSSEYSAIHSHRLQTRALRDMVQHLTSALPVDALVSRSGQGDWVLLVPGADRQAIINRLESMWGRPLQLPFGAPSEEMFVVLTPCAVLNNGPEDTLDTMLARAQDIWQRGVRTGAVDSQT